MDQTEEKRVFQSEDPELYERLENLMFEGATEIELDGRVYNVARDQGSGEREVFILMPVSSPDGPAEPL
jgi:hypothetical protein